MFISFFESFKYMGHMWPIALLRIYVGTYYFQAGFKLFDEGYLTHPLIQTYLQKYITDHPNHERFLSAFQNWILTHWQITSEVVIIAQMVVGVLFMIGFMVRPASLVAIVLSLDLMSAVNSQAVSLNKILIPLNIALFCVAAGRCYGFDYYFYKRLRGLWW